MNIWEFRRVVRERRFQLLNCCPLGAACGTICNPMPHGEAVRGLQLPDGYAMGIIAGFDHPAPIHSTLPGSDVFDAGERYGRRMRRVARHLRGVDP